MSLDYPRFASLVMKILRMFVVAMVGALGGALSAGSIYAIAVYTIPSLGVFGPGNLWWKPVGLFGAILGFLTGFFLGLAVGAIECGKVYASLLGGAIGSAIAAYGLASYFLSFGSHVMIRTICVFLALIPLSAVLGMVLVTMTRLSIWQGSPPAKGIQLQ